MYVCIRGQALEAGSGAAADAVVSGEEEISDVRLVGGRVDPQGRWEYGRLEVLVDSVWIAPDELTQNDNVGRRGVEVACESLGYATGAQLLAGFASALPSFSTDPLARRIIDCGGTEDSITDCDLEYVSSYYVYGSRDIGVRVDDVAVVCANPSGGLPLFSCA